MRLKETSVQSVWGHIGTCAELLRLKVACRAASAQTVRSCFGSSYAELLRLKMYIGASKEALFAELLRLWLRRAVSAMQDLRCFFVVEKVKSGLVGSALQLLVSFVLVEVFDHCTKT